MNANLLYWVWLTRAYGPANPAKWNAVSQYGSPKELFMRVCNPDNYYNNIPEFKKIASLSLRHAEEIIEVCNANGIKICCYDDADYPEILKEIYNPPSVLFFKGDISCLKDKLAIACVGTKSPSVYSVKVSSRIISDLVENNVVIVSGFAKGLDSLSNKVSLAKGGKTVAILPCGILHDFNPDDAETRQSIELNGAVISEFLPLEGPTASNYRARNRVLSGITHGTLILQAGARSGSLSTASYAISQGRELFCLPPHELYNSEYSGVEQLIRDGAYCVFNSTDILEQYFSSFTSIPEYNEPIMYNTESENSVEIKEVDLSSYTGDTRRLVEFILESNSVLYDEILDKFDFDDEILQDMLTELELDGTIRPLPGNRFTINVTKG